MSAGAVTLRGIAARYPGARDVVLDIDRLEIAAGERVALIGASGAGKSTLLRLLDGRLAGWRGEAVVIGHALVPGRLQPRSWRADTGFVFQEFALVEQATVRANVRNGRLGRTQPWRSLAGRFGVEDDRIVTEAMRDVGIEEFAARRVGHLSGGQRQRVAIARCLAQEPRLLLADEPVSNLDPATADVVLKLLSDCATKRSAALLVSSHQPRLVARHVDRIVALERGRIVFDDSPSALRDDQLNDLYEATVQPEAELAAA